MCPGDSSTSSNHHPSCLGAILAQQVADLCESAADLPVASSKSGDGFRMELRLQFDAKSSAGMTSIVEAKVPNIPPSAFSGFLDVDFKKSLEADPNIQSLDLFDEMDEDDNNNTNNNNNNNATPSAFRKEGVLLKLKFPFPLSNRVMVHWKYLSLCHNGDPNEYLLILSERDNESLMKKLLSDEIKRKYVLARTILSAYWIRPMRDANNHGAITGTTIQYVFSGDLGGSLPSQIQAWTAPTSVLRTVQSVVAYGQKHHNKTGDN